MQKHRFHGILAPRTRSFRWLEVMPLVLLSLWLISFLSLIGCGGGGGGSGRQTLPGENPLGPSVPTVPTTPASPTTPITPVPTVASPGALIADGWVDMGYGNYFSAQQKFQSVLGLASATTLEKSEALNGVGWAKGKSYGMNAAVNDFLQAGAIPESLIGLAAGYVQSSEPGKIAQAVVVLESLGLGDPLKVFTPTHPPIGMTNAEVHALLAYAYYWRNLGGDDVKARAQILAARASDSSTTSAVYQIYQALIKLGLTGI